MNNDQHINHHGFVPAFPDDYIQSGPPRRCKGSYQSITENGAEKFKKFFSRKKDEPGSDTETEAEFETNMYEICDQETRNDLQLQQSYLNNNYRNSDCRDTVFPFGNRPPDKTASGERYNILPQHVDYLDSSTSNKTFLTSNRVYHEPFNVVDPITSKPKKPPKQKDIKSPVVVVSSKHNILNNLHSALTDPHMGLKIGPTKFSDVCWRLESYLIKKKQGIKLLQKTINDFKVWTPQGDMLDPEDVSSMTDNFIELMENELEYELRIIRTLESTLSTLKTVASKEDRYMESQKQLKTSIKKYNDSKVKKNSKSGSNGELLRSEYKDCQRRYSTEQKILQESISLDLRKQYIFHNYYNFANNSNMIDKSKENVCDGLNKLLEVDQLTFQQTFGDIRQQRMTYNWNHLTTEEQENTRRQDNFQNGLVDKNDSLLGCIYKNLPDTQVPPFTSPRTDTESFQFFTGLGNENNELSNLTSNGMCINNSVSSVISYRNCNDKWNRKTPDIPNYSGDRENSTSFEGLNKENGNYEVSDSHNDTVIHTKPDHCKIAEPDISGSINRSTHQRSDVLISSKNDLGLMDPTENKWTEDNK